MSNFGTVAIPCACDPDAVYVGLSQVGSIPVCGMHNSSSQTQSRKSWTRMLLTVGEDLCAVPSKFSQQEWQEQFAMFELLQSTLDETEFSISFTPPAA